MIKWITTLIISLIVISPVYANSALTIADIIHSYNRHLPMKQARAIEKSLTQASLHYDVNPLLMLSILKVESSLKQGAVSSTGDFSISQINYRIWSHELTRLHKKPLNFKQLKASQSYAIWRMAEILHILKLRHRQDHYWYGHYHSGTPSLKAEYLQKVGVEIRYIKRLVESTRSTPVKTMVATLWGEK